MTVETTRLQPPPLTRQMEFRPSAKSARLVRKRVEQVLTEWGCGEDDIATAVLVASELATNAIEHARVPGKILLVEVTVTDRACLIEVSDARLTAPRVAHPRPDNEHGPGLQLVAALAEDFGHYRRAHCGKTVWARLKLTGATGSEER